jgi:hypothetical protein
MIVTTSATSLMIGGILGRDHQPLHNVLQQEMSPHQGGEIFVL